MEIFSETTQQTSPAKITRVSSISIGLLKCVDATQDIIMKHLIKLVSLATRIATDTVSGRGLLIATISSFKKQKKAICMVLHLLTQGKTIKTGFLD